MRILVVEDDRESASWLIKGLTEAGHVADHARDGIEGVALARERVHDVVVMDRAAYARLIKTASPKYLDFEASQSSRISRGMPSILVKRTYLQKTRQASS